ncbi:MAG: hypothetical protein Q7K43_05465 [Candidatus Woesearchaeota archaeon]|nr:hypothetical protein [Candidatus Woesearchaeota archaeon]
MKQFFKKLFGNQKEELALTPEQLSKWIANQQATETQTLKEHLAKTSIEAQHWITEATTDLQALQQAQLVNDVIPEQHKSMAEGNKEAFAKNVTSYLEQYRLPDIPAEIKTWLEKYNSTTKEFLLSTQRQTAVLQEFHAQETKNVLKNLRQIEQLANKTKLAFEQSKYHLFCEVMQKAKECEEKKNHQEELNKNITALSASIESYTKEQTNLLNAQQHELKDTQRVTLEQERITVHARIKQLEDNLRNMFSPLEAGLRKYAKLAPQHTHLVENYLASPSEALSQDVHLKIILVLAELQKHTWNETLELKQDKKNRTINAIAELTKPFLQKLITDYAKLKRDEVHLAQELISHHTSQQLNKLRQETEVVEQILKKKNTELEELQETLEANKPDYEGLLREISEKLEIKIKLVL